MDIVLRTTLIPGELERLNNEILQEHLRDGGDGGGELQGHIVNGLITTRNIVYGAAALTVTTVGGLSTTAKLACLAVTQIPAQIMCLGGQYYSEGSEESNISYGYAALCATSAAITCIAARGLYLRASFIVNMRETDRRIAQGANLDEIDFKGKVEGRAKLLRRLGRKVWADELLKEMNDPVLTLEAKKFIFNHHGQSGRRYGLSNEDCQIINEQQCSTKHHLLVFLGLRDGD